MGKRKYADRIYTPPWRDLRSDGTLGEQYGPRTPAAYARAVRNHQLWSYRYEHADPAADAAEVMAYMRPDGQLRNDVPDSEVAVYQAIYEQGMGIRETARVAGLNRSTVRSYHRRLRARVAMAMREASDE